MGQMGRKGPQAPLLPGAGNPAPEARSLGPSRQQQQLEQEMQRELQRGMQQLAAQQAPAEQGAALHTPNPVHPHLALAARVGLFVALLVSNGMVLLASVEERQTRRIRMLEFLGTACFVLLAACSLDSCLVEYGGKVQGLVRPLKSALFLPCYGLLVLLGSSYPDNVFAPFDLRDASAQAVVVQITVELFLNGVLAEFARWFVKLLVGEVPGCSLLAATAQFVGPAILFVRQPNLRLRIEYLGYFLAYKGTTSPSRY